MADQRAYGGLGGFGAASQQQQQAQPPPQQGYAGTSGRQYSNVAPPGHQPPTGAGPDHQQGAGFVGWGGQAIQDAPGYRVPWFGRSRAKYRHSGRGRDDRGGFGGRGGGGAGWGQPYALAAGPGVVPGRVPIDKAMTFEEMVSLIQKLPAREPIPDAIHQALAGHDSRAVALLLKDLSRVGRDKRAVELFDWLRGQDDRSPLRALCDVFTYTAMVSMCIYQQDVDRAMELVEDMRLRGIERNVHTYTALMNVCIKCGRLPLALDIYNSMKAVSCHANVVTYNTLVDVYGKLGQWERAVHVIDIMKQEGVEPVLRTFNTLVIACNMCNQPREALNVYHRLVADGYTPNATTFNALISAYGKTMQLDKALECYHEMLRQNMERSVITYSSLISACEKAGQWQTALRIFSEMQRDGCQPNTVSYNSLITACSQGGQWEKASEVFGQMGAHGCTPDVVSYTALISAFERGGQWQKALQAFTKMCMQGCKPDAIVYNAIIDTLWETGIIWAQSRALQLFLGAVQQGHFRQEPLMPMGPGPQRRPGAPMALRVDLNLHAMTAGVAMLSLYCWLLELKRIATEAGPQALPPLLGIVTDAGSKASREQGNCIVKEALAAMMNFWEAPFRPVQDNMYASVLEAHGLQVAEWVRGPAFTAQLASLFPVSDSSKLTEEMYIGREQQLGQDCAEAFTAVRQFEGTHGLVLSNMSPAYVQQRPVLISRLLDLSSKLGLRDEVVHDAVLLMDRTTSQAKQVPEDVLPLVGVAALVIAAKQGDSSDRVPTNAEIEQLTELPATSVAKMEWNIRGLLTDDISAISTMRCLKIYLERLGYRSLDKQDVYGMAGFAIMLAVESLYDLSLLNCRPSVVAAAILYAERRLRGAVPFWPSMLSRLSGYEDMATPELTVAVRVAQKLSRKLVYAQMYKAQLTQLAAQAASASGPLGGGAPSSTGTAASGGAELAPAQPMTAAAAGAAGSVLGGLPVAAAAAAAASGASSGAAVAAAVGVGLSPRAPPQWQVPVGHGFELGQGGGPGAAAAAAGPAGILQAAGANDGPEALEALTQAMQGLSAGGQVLAGMETWLLKPTGGDAAATAGMKPE